MKAVILLTKIRIGLNRFVNILPVLLNGSSRFIKIKLPEINEITETPNKEYRSILYPFVNLKYFFLFN